MWRSDRFRILRDAGAPLCLRLRGTLLLIGGRVLGNEFMKLAGRFDLKASRRRSRPHSPVGHVHPR